VPEGLNLWDHGRILLTTDAVGGVWRYTLDLARGMASRGLAPVIAVLGPPPDASQRAEAAGLERVETGLKLDWTAESAAELEQTVTALRALASGARSVHLHAPALAGHHRWPMPVVAVAHSCTATWWHAVRGGALPADFAWRAAATGAGLRTADAVIAPTRAHADQVQTVYGEIAIQIVPNGAPPPPLLPLPLAGLGRRADQGRGEGGPPQQQSARRAQSVLAAGRLWDEGKNLTALDRIAPMLDQPIYAAGPIAGPNGAAIALPHLHLLGSLSATDMQAAYTRNTVFAAPARYEPFGLSVLEAALAGMRLVLWDIPSFRELWDGVARFVADDAALLDALRAALTQPGDGGAQTRAQRYTLDAMVAATIDVHRHVGASV